MVIIVVLVGKKQSGKSTVAKHLCEKYGFVELAFADSLKVVVNELFGFKLGRDSTSEYKETVDGYWEFSPRKALQYVGDMFQEGMEGLVPGIGRGIWAEIVCRKIIELLRAGKDKIVISDLRFPHELDFLREKFSCIRAIKIIRSDNEIEGKDLHRSEIEMEQINAGVIIENNGTIEELFENVDSVVDFENELKDF